MKTSTLSDTTPKTNNANKRSRSPVLAGFVLLAVVVAGACSSSDPAADTGPAETTASFTRKAPDAVLLSLTWESETCTYEGPTELTAGPVELVFINGSEDATLVAYVNFLRLDEGKTIQDAYEGTEWPTTEHHESWMTEMGTWEMILAGRTASWVFDLEPADYVMVCALTQPITKAWWGGGFTVEG